MNDFDAIKNVYMAAKRKNKYILDRCTKLIIIPQMTLLDIKRIMENPQNNDEIQFAFTYLELAKTIINDGNLLCMEDVVKPFETKAFEYLSGAIRIQNKGMRVGAKRRDKACSGSRKVRNSTFKSRFY